MRMDQETENMSNMTSKHTVTAIFFSFSPVNSFLDIKVDDHLQNGKSRANCCNFFEDINNVGEFYTKVVDEDIEPEVDFLLLYDTKLHGTSLC
jgi:hypothetical protein